MQASESRYSSIIFATDPKRTYLSSQLSLYQPSYSRIIGESFRECLGGYAAGGLLRENFNRLSGRVIFDEAMTAVLGSVKLRVLAGQVNIESNCFFTIHQVRFQGAESGGPGRAFDHYSPACLLQRQLEAGVDFEVSGQGL
jgi:hypothetical protein